MKNLDTEKIGGQENNLAGNVSNLKPEIVVVDKDTLEELPFQMVNGQVSVTSSNPKYLGDDWDLKCVVTTYSNIKTLLEKKKNG